MQVIIAEFSTLLRSKRQLGKEKQTKIGSNLLERNPNYFLKGRFFIYGVLRN